MTEEVKGQKFEDIEELTVDILSVADDKYENLKEVLVTLEVKGAVKVFRVGMYKMFSPVGVKECVMEFLRNMDIARASDREGFGDISQPYMSWLMIKHFTTLGEKMPNQFSKQMDSLKSMINNGSFLQILVHFELDEIEKIKNEMLNALETFKDNEEIIDSMIFEGLDKIQFKSLVE